MTYINENTPSNEEGEEAVSNNYLMDKFLSSNSSNLMMLDNAAVLEYRSALNDIMDIINRFADEISASEEFSEASKYFEEAFSSLDGLFNNLMISILLTLKGLLHLLFSGFISIISAVFDAFEEITSLILRTLTKKINIPFFSNLYKLMIGDDLTPLNLIGFISATTSVTLSKIITGHTLFEDDKDVDEALESCRAVFSTVNRGNRVYTSKKVKQVFTIMSFYFATFYFIVSAWQDWQAAVTLPEPEPKPPDPEPEPKPPDPEPEPKPPEPKPKPKQINLIDVGALGLEMLWLIFSAPWFYDSKEEPAEYNDIVLWGWFFVGFGIDGFFLILEHSHIDKIKKGREITSFYGFVHLVLTAVFTGIKKTKAEECVPEFCGCVAEMSKFLVNLDSKRTWSRWIVPPIDGVTAVSLFLCELITVP